MRLNLQTYWLKSGFFAISQRFSVLFFGLVGYMLLVRMFDKSHVGNWELFLAITTILEMARNGLIQNSYIKYFISVKSEVEKSKFFSSSLILNLLFTLFTTIIICFGFLFIKLFGNSSELLLGKMMLVYIVTNLVMVILSECFYLQQANFDFRGLFWATLIRQGILFALIAVLYISNHRTNASIILIVIAQLIGTVMAAIFSIVYTRRYFLNKLIWDKKYVWTLFNYGKFTCGTSISSMIFKSVDKIMLYWLLSPSSVAIYGSAIRITNLIEYPATAMADIVFPKGVENAVENRTSNVKNLYEKSVGALLTFIIPIVLGVILFSKQIIMTINGPDYVSAISILKLTILFGLFTPFNRQFGTIMDSVGKPKLNFLLLITGLGINIVTNLVFINWFGLIGAAYGTLVSYLFTFVIGQFILNKHYKTTPFGCLITAIGFYSKGFHKMLHSIKGF